MKERHMVKQTWQAVKATVRFAKYLPLVAGLTLYGCSSCQNGVEKMGGDNDSTRTKQPQITKKEPRTVQIDTSKGAVKLEYGLPVEKTIEEKKLDSLRAKEDLVPAKPSGRLLRGERR